VISAIPGLNPAGGLPWESVQFYPHNKIVEVRCFTSPGTAKWWNIRIGFWKDV